MPAPLGALLILGVLVVICIADNASSSERDHSAHSDFSTSRTQSAAPLVNGVSPSYIASLLASNATSIVALSNVNHTARSAFASSALITALPVSSANFLSPSSIVLPLSSNVPSIVVLSDKNLTAQSSFASSKAKTNAPAAIFSVNSTSPSSIGSSFASNVSVSSVLALSDQSYTVHSSFAPSANKATSPAAVLSSNRADLSSIALSLASNFPSIVALSDRKLTPHCSFASSAASTSGVKRRVLSTYERCYRRDRLIAEGSQAKVYKFTPCTSDRPVAVKTMKRYDECTEAEVKFIQKFGEAKHYRGVPRLFDLIKTRRHLHVVMQYFEGTPLTNWKIIALRQMGEHDFKLYENRIMMVFYKIVAVLNMVHDAGQIHLDLKPRNILVDHYGNIMVLDFGGLRMKSRDRRSIEKLSCKYMYTRGYQAPELKENKKAGYASDIYSLGCSGLRLARRISNRIAELLPRLHRLIVMTTKENPKVRPTAKQLLSHEVFISERQSFYKPGDDPTSVEWLEKIVALNGPNKIYFEALPRSRDNDQIRKPQQAPCW